MVCVEFSNEQAEPLKAMTHLPARKRPSFSHEEALYLGNIFYAEGRVDDAVRMVNLAMDLADELMADAAEFSPR